jgi:hypothetical protein
MFRKRLPSSTSRQMPAGTSSAPLASVIRVQRGGFQMALNSQHPRHINPVQWQQSLGLARQSCARVFREGGLPADALVAFGLSAQARQGSDWPRAVELIAEHLCAPPLRRAA